VLFVITLTGLVMSYQWANDLLYRLTGSAGGGRGAPGADGRARRPARGGSRTRTAPGPDGRGPCARRPGRPLGARGATGAGLGPHQPARPGKAGWPGHLRHPGADRMASYAPLPAHPRLDHRRGRPLGAVRRPEARTAPAELGATASHRRGRRGGGPGGRADSFGRWGGPGVDRPLACLAPVPSPAPAGEPGAPSGQPTAQPRSVSRLTLVATPR